MRLLFSFFLFCLSLTIGTTSCRGPISANTIFNLAAFEPTDEEVLDATGAKAVVLDEDDNVPASNIRQKNRAVILDSDDEEEELAVLDSKMSLKKAGKQREVKSEDKKKKNPLPDWMDTQCVDFVPGFSFCLLELLTDLALDNFHREPSTKYASLQSFSFRT